MKSCPLDSRRIYTIELNEAITRQIPTQFTPRQTPVQPSVSSVSSYLVLSCFDLRYRGSSSRA